MFEFKTVEAVAANLATIKGGQFHHITFASMPKVVKGAEPIYKVSSATFRTGINPYNTEKAKAEGKEPKGTRNSDITYLLPRRLLHNNKTGKTLVSLVPKWRSFKTEFYRLNGEPLTKAEAAAVLAPVSRSNEPPIMLTVNAAMVLRIK